MFVSLLLLIGVYSCGKLVRIIFCRGAGGVVFCCWVVV